MCRARGDWPGAWDAINQVKDEVPRSHLKIGPIIITQARFHLDQGDLAAAEQLIQAYEIGATDRFNLNTMGVQRYGYTRQRRSSMLSHHPFVQPRVPYRRKQGLYLLDEANRMSYTGNNRHQSLWIKS